ncbi:MAG: exodeoxyribonuclease VII small subunit [Lachnospiraceae bacterium]|nr:exodeoxyribonuclease VII small subunit [Lachnospiraceae bacterium]
MKKEKKESEEQLMHGGQQEQEKNDLSLEEAFEQIEEVISHLETEEITLEQSFLEYNRGMKLLQHCNEKIDRVEKKVLQINEDGGLDEF